MRRLASEVSPVPPSVSAETIASSVTVLKLVFAGMLRVYVCDGVGTLADRRLDVVPPTDPVKVALLTSSVTLATTVSVAAVVEVADGKPLNRMSPVVCLADSNVPDITVTYVPVTVAAVDTIPS